MFVKWQSLIPSGFVELALHLMHSSSSLQCKFFLYYGLSNLPCSEQLKRRRRKKGQTEKSLQSLNVGSKNKNKNKKNTILLRNPNDRDTILYNF
jgi:hypothetical protein